MEGSESVPRKLELQQMVIQVSFGDSHMAAFTEDGKFSYDTVSGTRIIWLYSWSPRRRAWFPCRYNWVCLWLQKMTIWWCSQLMITSTFGLQRKVPVMVPILNYLPILVAGRALYDSWSPNVWCRSFLNVIKVIYYKFRSNIIFNRVKNEQFQNNSQEKLAHSRHFYSL